jgi:hypothetical protein
MKDSFDVFPQYKGQKNREPESDSCTHEISRKALNLDVIATRL